MQYILILFTLLSSGCVLGAAYDLSICAIFQDEAPYFKEWIEFHKLQGVKHFYLYDNISQDNYHEVLDPYILSDEVTLIPWPYTYDYGAHTQWIKIQTDAYMHCIKNYGNDNAWLAFIDIDEFLFCPEGQNLPKFLKSYKKYAGLCVNWLKFGTSDIEDIPPGKCMIELLTKRSEQQEDDNRLVKSIVQPKRVLRCISPHHFKYKSFSYAVSVNKEPCRSFCTEFNNTSTIRINHYWTRTIKYLLESKMGSRQKRRPQYTYETIMDMAASYNVCHDTTIQRYVEDLREAMGFEGN